MEPQIVTREAFTVLGITDRINPMTADYRMLWEDRFMPRYAEIKALAGNDDGYSVYFPTEQPGIVDFIAGMPVADDVAVPEGLVKRQVPAGLYAVVECDMAEIGSTWGYLYGQWAANSPQYQPNPTGVAYEFFPPGVMEGTARVSIFMAITPRA